MKYSELLSDFLEELENTIINKDTTINYTTSDGMYNFKIWKDTDKQIDTWDIEASKRGKDGNFYSITIGSSSYNDFSSLIIWCLRIMEENPIE